MRRLSKREVEALLDAVERAGEDIDAVRAALAAVGVPPSMLAVGLDELFELAATLNETRRVPDADLLARARAWLEDDPDAETREELQRLLDGEDTAQLTDRFRARLGFGTAGIRGRLGAGPNRMNVAVVRATAAGIAAWVQEPERGVVVGRDARRRSDDFARDVACVLAGAGIRALAVPGQVPTPVVAFAVRHLGAAAGVMVTASHNPPDDNGVKVYGDDGAQIIPPADLDISAHIHEVGAVRDIPLGDDVENLGPDIVDAYLEHAASTIPSDGPRDVKVVHTALHGVGWEPLRRLFEMTGFPKPVATWEQAHPDGSFPTLPFPNPEEPGALDRALAVARAARADVLLANDPDADRLGVAVRTSAGWRQLTGDEIGVLLADHVLRLSSGADRLVACSLVSSSMLERIAAAHRVHFRSTLTGFKWIVRAADDIPGARFVFGYEEALGYAIGDRVRDKDGLTAALAVADLVARLKAEGATVDDRLAELYGVHGFFATRQRSIRRPVPEIDAAVQRILAAPPSAIAGQPVLDVERPASDILVLRLEGDGRVIIRPSGTEPKLKTYLQVVLDDVDRAAADAELDRLGRGVLDVLGLGD